MRHLSLQRPLDQSFCQMLNDPTFAEQVIWFLVALEQFIYDFGGDFRLCLGHLFLHPFILGIMTVYTNFFTPSATTLPPVTFQDLACGFFKRTRLGATVANSCCSYLLRIKRKVLVPFCPLYS